MSRIPWTKFQDFYLRLGYLKVLVAVLNPERRSVVRDAIVRRLQSPLFDSASEHPALWERVRGRFTWYPRTTKAGRTIQTPAVDEAMLIDGEVESVLYGVTKETAYKILDWGQNVDFVGRGNQITEQALILRQLLPAASAERFVGGDVEAWNPFVLSVQEKAFFLYHLANIDLVTLSIIDQLSTVDAGTVIETGDASRITCRGLFAVLKRARSGVAARDIPAFRTAHELACTIANELNLDDFRDECDANIVRRAPKPVKPSARRSAFSRAESGPAVRKTRKNADHQTIPRFEQLVDLGFLIKVPSTLGLADEKTLSARRRWRYVPTTACGRWMKARACAPSDADGFKWNGFAAAATAALHPEYVSHGTKAGMREICEYLWRAYECVHRPTGHTPFDSVALLATILAVSDGVVIEMVHCHSAVIRLKEHKAFSNQIFFAGGNDLDKMFVQIKAGFLATVEAATAGELGGQW